MTIVGHGRWRHLGPLWVSGLPAGSAGMSECPQQSGCLFLGARGQTEVPRCPSKYRSLKQSLQRPDTSPQRSRKTTSGHQCPHPPLPDSLGIESQD